MSSPLAKSMRAGLSIQSSQALVEAEIIIPDSPFGGGKETGALGEPAPDPERRVPTSGMAHHISPVRPFYRRTGWRLLYLLKPLASPFLHRVDMRTRSSVDQSGLAAVVRGIDAKLDALMSEVATTRARTMQVDERLRAAVEQHGQMRLLVDARLRAMTEQIRRARTAHDSYRSVPAGTAGGGCQVPPARDHSV